MILNYVAIKLYETFGYEIHKHEIAQGIEEPCFLVTVVEYAKQQLLNTRSIRRLPLDIIFFPSEGKTQCYEVADKLMNALEVIGDENDKFAGVDMHAEVIDDVLHFFVTYKAIVYVETPKEEAMEELIANGEVNG